MNRIGVGVQIQPQKAEVADCRPVWHSAETASVARDDDLAAGAIRSIPPAGASDFDLDPARDLVKRRDRS